MENLRQAPGTQSTALVTADVLRVVATPKMQGLCFGEPPILCSSSRPASHFSKQCVGFSLVVLGELLRGVLCSEVPSCGRGEGCLAAQAHPCCSHCVWRCFVKSLSRQNELPQIYLWAVFHGVKFQA